MNYLSLAFGRTSLTIGHVGMGSTGPPLSVIAFGVPHTKVIRVLGTRRRQKTDRHSGWYSCEAPTFRARAVDDKVGLRMGHIWKCR